MKIRDESDWLDLYVRDGSYAVTPKPSRRGRLRLRLGSLVKPGALLFGGLCGPTIDLRTVQGQQKLTEIRAYFRVRANAADGVKQP